MNIDKFHRNVTLLTLVCQVWTVDFPNNVKVGYSWHREKQFASPDTALKLFQAITCLKEQAEIDSRSIDVRMLMPNKKINLYSQAHLMVAAIRVYEHLNGRPPTVDDVCRVINFSTEQGHFICRKLQEIDIVKAVEGSYGIRLFINDHLKLEDLPRTDPENKLEDDLKKFQDTQKAFSRKIESFQAQQKQKKKDLFAEMEKKLKEELEKK